jgi:hypothetical protein
MVFVFGKEDAVCCVNPVNDAMKLGWSGVDYFAIT